MQLVVHGLVTNYQRFGSGQETIVFLHGWKRSLQDWLPIAQKLQDRYQIIALDLPGMGATPRPKETYDTYQYAQFVADFLEKVGIKQAIILGHSFGGRLAIILASQHNLATKLILVDSAGVEEKSFTVKLRIAFYKYVGKPLRSLIPQPIVHRWKKRLGGQDYQQAGALQDILVKVVNQDLQHLLPKITVPTVILWGEKDQSLPLWQAVRIHQRIKNSILRLVWGAGHLPFFDAPRQFLAILQEYV